jgi:hypothetical protein
LWLQIAVFLVAPRLSRPLLWLDALESKGSAVIVERCREDVLKFSSSVWAEQSSKYIAQPRVTISTIETALNGRCMLQAAGYVRALGITWQDPQKATARRRLTINTWFFDTELRKSSRGRSFSEYLRWRDSGQKCLRYGSTMCY